jgi:hypothetical protein
VKWVARVGAMHGYDDDFTCVVSMFLRVSSRCVRFRGFRALITRVTRNVVFCHVFTSFLHLVYEDYAYDDFPIV